MEKTTLYRQYAALMEQMKLLEEEKETLKASIISELVKEGTDKVETDWGKFTIAGRTSWKYSDKVTALSERLKLAKIREEEKGIATSTETKYLVYTLNKE